MQYLTRVILSGLSPRSMVQSRKIGIALFLIALVAVALLAVILSRQLISSERTMQEELGLKPLHAIDDDGSVWIIEPAAAQPFAHLREGQADPGLPLMVRTEVQRQNAGEISIGLVIEGRAGERYLPGISKNGVRLPAPAFMLVNEAGRVMHADQFKYG